MRPSSCFVTQVRWERHTYPHAIAVAGMLVGALACPSARALQVLDARDGVAIEAILSIKEPTRIRIEGVPITDVFGNIHSSNCGGAAGTAAARMDVAEHVGDRRALDADARRLLD